MLKRRWFFDHLRMSAALFRSGGGISLPPAIARLISGSKVRVLVRPPNPLEKHRFREGLYETAATARSRPMAHRFAHAAITSRSQTP